MYILLLLSVFTLPITGYTDTIDSLQYLIDHTKVPAKKAAYMNVLAQHLLKSQPKSSLTLLQNALDILEPIQGKNTDSITLEIRYTTGLYYARIQQLDSVIQVQSDVLKRALPQKYTSLLARAYVEQAIAFESLGNYEQALQGYFEALRIYEQQNDLRGVMYQCVNVGLIYQYQKDYKSAITYFQRTIRIGKQLNDQNGIITAYNNLGIVFQEQNDFAAALNCFKLVLKHDLLSGDSINIGDSYNNIGTVYLGLKNYKLAEWYFNTSLYFKGRMMDNEGYANTCNNLAEVYIELNPSKALTYLVTARKLAEEGKFNAIILENNRVFVDYYKKVGDYPNALIYSDRYHALKDSLKLEELSMKIAQIQKQYELEKTVRRVIEQDNELTSRKYKQGLYLTLFLFFFSASLFLVYHVLRTRKLNKRLRRQKIQISQKNDQLISQNQLVVQSRDAAEQAAQAKSQFLSIMSHEIRTPLNAIIGLANLLEENNPRPDQLDNINVLKQSSINLLAILNDILDLSKIEAGKMSLNKVDFNLRNTVQNVFNLYTYNARNKGVNFELRIDDALPTYLHGDPLHLNQILTNLLSNAVKFTQHGGVTLEVIFKQKTFDANRVEFRVTDTGIGIPEHKLATIFESFTQADAETTRKFGGTGLGLTICKKLLELQQSDLHVKSRVGFGSEFSFILNFNDAQAPLSASQEALNEEPNFEGAKVLLAEDNEVNEFVVRQFLEKWGIEIVVAQNGQQAVDIASKHSFDLILMDLHMPILDGLDATKQILKNKPKTKIVALTATSEDEVKEAIKEVGMVGFITKPFHPDELANKLAALLD